MLRWPDYFVDPPNDTTSGDVNNGIDTAWVLVFEVRGNESFGILEDPGFFFRARSCKAGVILEIEGKLGFFRRAWLDSVSPESISNSDLRLD